MQLETKFDKEKAIVQQKLNDALRENDKLQASLHMMNQQLVSHQEKIQYYASVSQDSTANALKFEELNTDLQEMMKDRDQYFMKLTEQEIEVKNTSLQLEKLKIDHEELLKAH